MWSSCSLIYKVTYTRILWSSLLSLNSSHVSEWWCGKTHQRMTSYWCQSLREVNLKMSYNSRASELKLLLMQPVKLLSRVRLFEIPWTVAYQVPPFMEFSRQKYWSGLPFPPPEDLPDPGIAPQSPTVQADALLSKPLGKSLTYADKFKELYLKEFVYVCVSVYTYVCVCVCVCLQFIMQLMAES